MKKTLRGFTLVELLITMAIVGAVAALTIPGLVSGTNKASTGPELARVVERLEVGLRNVIDTANKNIVEEGGEPLETLAAIQTKDLFPGSGDDTYIIGISGFDDNLFGNTGNLTGTEYIDKDDPSFGGDAVPAAGFGNYINELKGYDGGESYSKNKIIDNATIPFRIKKMNAIVVPYIGIADNSDTKKYDKPDSIIGYVYVDINGEKKPNKEGHDIFLFGVRNNGSLVPAGTEEFEKEYGDSLSFPLAKDACSGDTITNGLSCTARVAANGWKVDY